MEKGLTFLQECALKAKRFEFKDGGIKEVDPSKSRAAANPAYRTPEDGEDVGFKVIRVTRQEKWRRKNKAKVAAYMRDYRARQKEAK